MVDAGRLFELVVKSEKKILSLDGNKIRVIPPNKLVGRGTKFSLLQIVNLNDWEGVEVLKTIIVNKVVNLPNLAQLSLGKNKTEKIEHNAIILNDSKPITKHISIFLNDDK
jgi:Leucine-rich repeat (LRR) protein